MRQSIWSAVILMVNILRRTFGREQGLRLISRIVFAGEARRSSVRVCLDHWGINALLTDHLLLESHESALPSYLLATKSQGYLDQSRGSLFASVVAGEKVPRR